MIISQAYPLWVAVPKYGRIEFETVIAWKLVGPMDRPTPITAESGELDSGERYGCVTSEAGMREMRAEFERAARLHEDPPEPRSGSASF